MSLSTALDFYTESQVSYSATKFKKLVGRLKKADYTAFEFLHYVAHYHGLGTKWERLRRVNLLASDKCWKAFEAWKQDRLNEIHVNARLQYESAEEHADMGHDLTMILMKEFLTASPVSRVELALYWDQQGRAVDRTRVVRLYGCAAAELAIGAPEWLHVAPTFRSFAQEKYEDELEDQVEWTLLYLTMQAKNLISNIGI